MTNPTVATPYCSYFKDNGKLQLWKLLLKTSRHPEMISHSALFSLFRFIILEVLSAGIFAVLANMMMMSNLMFPEFLQGDFHGRLLSITWKRRSLQTLEMRTVWGEPLGLNERIQVRMLAIS